MSSRICFPGYMIGYIASGVESPALFKSLVPMDSKLRSVSRGQLAEMATTKAARRTRLKNSLGAPGTPHARGARAGGTGTAMGLGAIVGATASAIVELRLRRVRAFLTFQ